MKETRVVITGIGTINPLGHNTENTWQQIINGESGVDFLTSFDTEGFDTRFGAEVKGFVPEDKLDRKDARRMDRFAQFACVAALEACESANLSPQTLKPYELSVIIGSGIGGIVTLSEQHNILSEKGPRRVSPFLIPMMLGDMASAQVSMMTGAMGANYCVVSSCSSGADAIGQAWYAIKSGQSEIILAGGAEAPLTPIAVAGFNSLRALSRFNENPKQASRPFDIKRDGFVMGEGSAILVLESEEHAINRGATPLAILSSYGSSSDAHHLTEPNPTGKTAAQAINNALSAAKISPDQIDYLNAHGTSTPLNDTQETKAIKLALGESSSNLHISSTKSMTGHLLGAGGALEAALCVKAIQDSIIPPTINLEEPDPLCDLDYTPNQSKNKTINTCMSNSFGFGGHNSVLIFSKHS
ncbi:MAG: beta-ketoacyl-ACP synthase II [SAR202 cluster bacterium]|mgnify:FL=1|jgi:3-oxoacyl-[acyl-carrier-protein] synthase II|nr:beta-ketoacyl-ACP synthase II [Dehalococcoidia bacterium]MQG17358.1 beta-ketoacyl-ACP synthase II [SAR202 cluster bacterium]CAI8364827.1 MAG: 3-oxoacyl-[acyl-carrier-protein] synthase 2 [Chloroflexota bacterium]MQG36273.1 beta-ketoacyl-ACP synthase II [SAR202 cluster bacterium]MQG60391.1 beta-ketoacyl-ACP synthase II [SAR202 cluster bacterium]|tara:strand:- start:3938 stop:5179 length:1242 start_codon:yes stop_codon:yes gene_type:complete